MKTIVGIFSTINSTAENQFRRWLKPIVNNSNILRCGLNFVFVYGNNAQKREGRAILKISENMNKGKSSAWIQYAHAKYHADYIFKMDSDTNVCLRSLLSEVESAFVNKCDYIGKVMDYNSCGRQRHCPPTKWMSMFDRLGKWAYMSGFFYGISKKTGLIDYDQVKNLALKHKPKMIICGASAYSRDWDYGFFRDVADEVNAILLA